MHDLGIIGAGPAGYVAAERASNLGLSVVLFDKKELGGVCLNEGCIPTKTLLYSAKLLDNARNSHKYGILCKDVSFDFRKIMQRKDRIVEKLVGDISVKMQKNNIKVVKAKAVIKERGKDHLLISANNIDYSCKNVLICTGSEAIIPNIKGVEKEFVLTNREILKLKELPESLNIIGGGVVGIEFASFFATLGTKVSVFEMLDEILPGVDREISKMLRKELSNKNIDFYLGTKITAVDKTTVSYEKEGKVKKIKADKLLVSVGRKANVEGFGLEKSGVEFTAKGIKIDKQCRTNIPTIFAAGDVTGFSLLAHTANREAEVAVNNIAGIRDTMRYNAIPAVVYTNPEVSCVGLTEDEAKEKNIPVKILKLPLNYAGRFVVENEESKGLAKIVVGQKFGEILGVHMIGNPSSEIIYGAAMAIEMEMREKDIKEVVFPHPTVSEIFKEIVLNN